MDWASSQWKEGLSSIAVQKINALEEKVEKLLKERQQKQIQFECLELTLGKEKRKVEQEKQQTARLERELQSLADTCKDLENKQQKLLVEIQNRDSRQNNLESQLAQSRKQNCRLQQLEKDIEELRSVRENTKLEQKELEEKLKKEQITIVKQSDAISDLEQTIKSLKEKSFTDKPLIVDSNKENIGALNTAVSDDKYSDSLKKKVVEQENIIKSLKEQLKNIGREKTGPTADVLSPVKSSSSETPVKNSFNFWDSFGSTPAKAGKVIKHHLDSSAFDDSDEKVRHFQLKIKQLTQELECQRHNSEAAKNALEQRLKEKENILKVEIKQQAQTIADLDKELRELQNKYQQEVVQANKKLDIVNAQFQKSELSKQQIEKDLKNLEMQINSRNIELQQKNDELKDLHKIKNSLEVTSKKLHSEKRDLEQNNTALQAQKNSWLEEVRDLKLQLEGSNNLVKEKETLLQSMKKEQDCVSRINSEFQIKIKELENSMTSSTAEISSLKNKLTEFSLNEVSMQENIKQLKDDNSEISNTLKVVSSEKFSMESRIKELMSHVTQLQSDNASKDQKITLLDKERENCDIKIKELENSMTLSAAEISSLKNKLTEFSLNEVSMQENIKQLKDDNSEISNTLKVVGSEKLSMESHIKELMSNMTQLQSDNASKDQKITLLDKERGDMKQNYDVKIKELEHSLTSSNAALSGLKNSLDECTRNESSLQENIKQLKDKNCEISKHLDEVTSKNSSLESQIYELESQLALLQTDNNSKEASILQLENEAANCVESYNNKMKELEMSLTSSTAEISSLNNKLAEFLKKEVSMEENIKQLTEDNDEVSKSLKEVNSEKTALESQIVELRSHLAGLQADNKFKDEKITLLEKETADGKESYTNKMKELENSLTSSTAEISSLNNKLAEFLKKELLMEKNIKQLKEDNDEVSKSLKEVNSEKTALESQIVELRSHLAGLQADNKFKDEKITLLEKETADVKESYNNKIEKMESSSTSSTAEISSLNNKLAEFLKKEVSMEENMKQLKEDNNAVSKSLKEVNSEKTALESQIIELRSHLEGLQADNKSKDEKITLHEKETADVKKSYNNKMKELEDSLTSSTAEIFSLNNKLAEFSEKEVSMEENIKQLKEDNNEVSKSLKEVNSEKTALESQINELRSHLEGLQTDNKFKDEKITLLEKESTSGTESYNNKIEELENSLTSSTVEISSLNNKLAEFSKKEMSMEENIKQLKEENSNVSRSLNDINSEKTDLESQITDLRSLLTSLQTDTKSKDEKITLLENEISNTKENFNIEVNNLKDVVKTIKTEKAVLEEQINGDVDLKNTLQETEIEKQKLVTLLAAEEEKRGKLKAELVDLNENLQNLKSELDLKEGSQTCAKLHQIQNTVPSVCENADLHDFCCDFASKPENDFFLNAKAEMMEFSNTMERYKFDNDKLVNQIKNAVSKEALEKIENEKALISDALLSETEKARLLESKVEDLNTNITSQEGLIISAVSNELILKTEMECMRENFENEISILQQHNKSLVSKISTLEKELEESSFNETVWIKKLGELKVENQKISLLTSSERELKIKVNDLQTELIEKNISVMKLESEISLLLKNHEEEKSQIHATIEDVKSDLLSMCESMGSIVAKNEVLQIELSSIKEEWQMKETDDRKVRYEFLDVCFNYLESIENIIKTVIMNYEERKSLLTTKLCEMESEVALKSEQINNCFEEKENLLAKIKCIQEQLNSKELELQNSIVNINDYIVAVENLKNDKETLIHANDKFQKEISNLETELQEKELLIVGKGQDYDNILEEKANLHKELERLELILNEKELQLEHMVLFKNEQLILSEDLNKAKMKLEEENKQLMDEISDLKNRFCEMESLLTSKCQDYEVIFKENVNLCEKVKLIEERLSEKELELEKNSSATDEMSTVIEDLQNAKKNIGLKNSELQQEISSVHKVLITAENTLHSISSKIADIVLANNSVFETIKVLQEQSFKSSEDLRNFIKDCSSDKSDVQAKSKEIVHICHFVLECLNSFQAHLEECQNTNIPESVVLEIENNNSVEETSNDWNISCSHRDIASHSSAIEKYQSKFHEELTDHFKDVYKRITSFEERSMATKERCQFMAHHQLVPVDDFRKMLVTLKHMRKLCIKLYSKKLALESLENSVCESLSKHKSCENMFTTLNLLSDDQHINEDVHVFFKKCLLVNTYKDLYVASKMNKAFKSLKSFINTEVSKSELYFTCFEQYENVNFHYLHIPIIIKTDYLLFMHSISVDLFHVEEKFRNETVNYGNKINMIEIKQNLSAAKVPLVLNCLYKLHEKNSTKYDENLTRPIINKLLLFYEKNHSSISLETSMHIENLLYLLSKDSHHSVDVKQFTLFQNLMCSLLEDLSLMAQTIKTEKDDTDSKELFDVLLYEIDDLKSENNNRKIQIDSLKESLMDEQKQQKILNGQIKEIECNLRSVISLKEKWRKKVIEVSKLCSVLKSVVSGGCDISQLQSEFAALSDNFCLCEQCLVPECESHTGVDHIIFTPVNLIHFVAELYMSKEKWEKEVLQLNATNTDISQKVAGLENELENAGVEYSTLNQSLCELKERVNVKEYELDSLKTKYSCLENEYQCLNSQFVDSNNAHTNLKKMFDDKLNELNKCELQYQEVFSENQRIKDEIVEKEQKMAQCEKTITEKMSEYETLTAKSADYEAKIDDLNSTINSLTSHVKELNNKVLNLEKSNTLLNATVETVEEDLQNTYMEKQKLEENLQEKIIEIERLKQEISSANNNVTKGIDEVSNLELTIKELRDALQSNKKEFNELQNNNCKLQNEMSCSSKIIKELKVSLLEKNFCIQKNDSSIARLKETISGCGDEKKNLEMRVIGLNDELEKKITLLNDLEDKLFKASADKEALQSQITDLLAFKHERLNMLNDEENFKMKCDELISEKTSLRLEIENLTQEKSDLKNKIKVYCDKISAVEAELKETVKLKKNLNDERDDLRKKLHILKEDMRLKSKSQLENSLLIQELTQKVDKLRKEVSDGAQIADKKINELSQKNTSLNAEINILKSHVKIDSEDSLSETSSLKSLDKFKGFLKKFIDMLARAIKKIECSSDIEKYKSELLLELCNMEDNIIDLDSFINKIDKKLQSFLQHYIGMQKDLESKLDSLAKAAFKYVTELHKYCESDEVVTNFDVTALGDISCLNDTLCTDNTASNTFVNCDVKKLTNDMQKSCEIVDSHFNSMRNTILKKEMDIKSLQDNLTEIKQLKDSLPNEKQNTDSQKASLESKCKLLLSNAHRLEKKHNKLIQTCEELETRIKVLEKEKQDLENEAEEMAAIIRDQNSSDELLEISKRLAESNKQLEVLKDENGCLKSALRHYETFIKENSMSVSKVTEQSQSSLS